ncbi:hypothetical protein CV83915_2p0188 (plasmid) [Escherichia coli]|uniref:Uncharacterized protein n=1 Tax=Escherichia coli TaxID=562 RepID=A0A2H4TKW1_ECOLX|nr:hypothetical protein CV83915_2p0188 [Escherichia coli]
MYKLYCNSHNKKNMKVYDILIQKLICYLLSVSIISVQIWQILKFL